jgi:hypothetical protein
MVPHRALLLKTAGVQLREGTWPQEEPCRQALNTLAGVIATALL